jgi:hypothetical protein
VLNNLSLDEEQCNAYFPGLTKEIDDVVAEGPFVVKQTGDMGPLQGRIKNGQVRSLPAFATGASVVDGVGIDIHHPRAAQVRPLTGNAERKFCFHPRQSPTHDNISI